ncbi:two-component regulator propeller domain-containing protein [Marinimicrobium sp. ABcell2]|uniref:two-component regulator propeller domain-containing protein n=1 Tax=Marinimicrobium sp. ABcell2 TaxID=3069751 RepID=UPI0027AEE7F7|nr:two-component regulator propeller domain-containing protein [Marinimicrobium sp. ABcell2]MDQ2075139.1 two-component regulator propeller domain-containing protein [Marinimicrobium sp. ABcell2]
MNFGPIHLGSVLFALFLIVTLPAVGFASSGMEPNLQSLRFKTFDSSELNSIGNPNAITQDSRGFMWIGGLSGLARFDGKTTKIYRNDANNPKSVSNNYVRDLLVDSQGRLWVATRGGLNLYDPVSDTFTRYQHDPNNPHSLSHNAVTSLAEDKEGGLWIATLGGGLNLFDPKTETFIRYQHDANNPASLASNNLRVVYTDHEGSLWIGTSDAGLTKLDPNTTNFTHYPHNPDDAGSLGSNTVRSLIEDRQHRIWVGTLGGGLNQLDKKTGTFIRYGYEPQNSHGPGLAYIQALSESDDGRLWVASDGGGLNLFDPATGRFERFDHRPHDPTSLLADKVQAIFKDQSGDWWFTHFPTGISKTDPYASAFRNYRHELRNENSLSNSGILSIAEDAQGNFWIGTEDGLNHLNPKTGAITRYKHDPKQPNSVPAPAVLDVSILTDNQLWVGTWGGGASRFDEKTGGFTALELGTGGNHLSIVWVIYEDNQQNIWMGSEGGGLVRYDPETELTTQYLPDQDDATSITSNIVLALHEDSLGNFWVGTSDGLNLMNRADGSFTRFKHIKGDPTSLSGNEVWSIVEDSKGNLWIGTRGGINKFDRRTEKFTVYQAQEGLPNDTVKGILEDEQGYLWLSTENGLSRFNPDTETFRHYTAEHGLPGNLFNRPAYLKTSTGELIFGSTTGLTVFNPEHLFIDESAHPVVFTDFQLFNRAVPIGGENSPLQKTITHTDKIKLTPDQAVFSLSFALLNYRTPQLSQYAYKLEGFDGDWNEVGSQRSATYTNLDAGSYVFRVKASNGNGIWSQDEAELQIVVLPPWYETNLFRFSLIVLILGALQLIFLYRVRRIRRSEQKLAAQVRERTKELEEKNKEIEHLANHDPLTGLPSLRLANQRLKIALNMAKRKEHIAAVLFLDLDGFKAINDTYGHEAGDVMLVEAALRIQKVIRDYDTACRIGGDEFLVILSEVESVSFIEEICARILSQISAPFTLDGMNLKLEASIGCAYYPKHGDTEDMLKKTADRLMYEVKARGKNNYQIG